MNVKIIGPSLKAEMAAVEQGYPGWHVWADKGGTVNATHCLPRAEMRALETRFRAPAICGVTLFAPTPELIVHEIAAYQRTVRCAA